MNCKSFVAFFASLYIIHGAGAQEVRQVTVGDNMNFGITYNLPKTGLIATIDAQCTTYEAGPYAAYAEKFLGIDDVMLENKVRWEILNISLSTVAHADTSRTYHIDFNEKASYPTFYFTDERCLWSINQRPASQAKQPAAPQSVSPAKAPLKASDVLTSEILKAGSKVKQAELVAQEIFSIRESRSMLIKGEADNMPGDGVSLQLMLDNLTAQEEALLSLFVGNTTVTTSQYKTEYMSEKSVERDLFFRFSERLGLVDKDDLAGAPYYISVLVTEDNRMQEVVEDKNQKKNGILGLVSGSKASEKGIAFCIPGKVHVSLFTASQTLLSGEFSMGQFGHVEQLPVSQFTDRKRPTSALFNPETGSIKMFEQNAVQ